MEFRLGVVQTSPKFLKPGPNVREAFDLMDKQAADLWVLPELFTSGYNFKTKKEAAKCAERADGPLSTVLKAYAAKNGCAIAAGFAEKAGSKLYNSALLVKPDGKTRVYRKSHLFASEKKFFAPGDTGFWVEDVKGVKVGLMVCFDWFFPESTRTLALKGAQVVAHCANLVLPWCPEGMKFRCLENRIYAATSNRIGSERGLKFIGNSQIVAPNGTLLARAGDLETRALVLSVDAWTAKDKKLNKLNDLFADRRPKLYAR